MFETSTVSRLGICRASDVCSHKQDSMVWRQVLEDCWDFDDTGQRPPGIKPCAEQRHYSSKESFGRDIVAELIAAARKEGIHPGLYISHADWYLLRKCCSRPVCRLSDPQAFLAEQVRPEPAARSDQSTCAGTRQAWLRRRPLRAAAVQPHDGGLAARGAAAPNAAARSANQIRRVSTATSRPTVATLTIDRCCEQALRAELGRRPAELTEHGLQLRHAGHDHGDARRRAQHPLPATRHRRHRPRPAPRL